MNINLYQLILEQLLIFLEPITLAVNSDRNQDRLFAEIAWDINLIDDFPRTKLNEKLSKFVQEYQTLESTINDPPKSFSEWLKDLENAENALNTLQDLKNELGELGNRIPQLQELDQDLIGFLIIRYLQNWRPQWYQLALLCNVINFDTTTLEPVADGNSIVRFPQRHPLIELEEVIPKITALLTNPVPTLKTIYFGASQRMENEAEANAAADKLFPILGAFLQTLGAEVIYGWKAKEYGLDIGIAGEKLGRKMLTFAFVPDEGNNYFGATLSLSPKVIVNPEDNANVNSDLGLIVRPFGSFTPSEDEAGLSKVTFLWFAKDSKTGFKNTNSAAIIGIWEVEVQLTSGIEGFAIGPESATWLPANLSSVKGNIRLTKLLPSHEFAFILGSPIGSRLEIKSFQSFANINISQDTSLINYEVGINLENVALIFPEFLEIDIQQLEITLAKTQSRFKFKSFALSIPALFNQDIKGDLQLLFENGQLQLGSNQSYFKRFEPDEDNAVTLPLDGIYFDQNCLILRWQERRINFWLKS